MRPVLPRIFAVAFLALAVPILAHAAPADRGAAAPTSQWVTAWAGPMQSTTATFTAGAAGITLHEAVWATVDGDAVRVKFSNAMGTSALTISGATIGIKGSGSSVVAGTLRQLTFGGNVFVDVPIQG